MADQPDEQPSNMDLGEPDIAKPPEELEAVAVSKTELPAYRRAWQWYLERLKWSLPATIILLALIAGLIPFTRYHLAGLVLKKDVSIKVIDATANVPVSGALVSIGNVSATTDNTGKAVLHHLSVGQHRASVTKKYYQDNSLSVLVPILNQKNIPSVQFTATGRQARITLVDLVNAKKISNASISIAGATATTDKNGQAIVVVPVSSSGEKATIKADGYNDANVTVEVSGSEIKDNTFKLTPAGQVYFLSKLSGTIDVVKTNLDGTDRRTVLAGTGKEDSNNTVLLASRDWKYLALLSTRDGGLAKLFVLNTDDDKLLTMDEGNATFTPVGWYNHRFIYTVSRNGYNAWQPNAFSVKSYNSDTGQILTLVNNNASGSSNFDAQYEVISDTQIMGNDLVYTRTWYQYPGYLNVAGKQNVLAAIHPDGTNSRQLKTVDAASQYITNLKLNKPTQLYFAVISNDGSTNDHFLLDKSGNISPAPNVTDQQLLDEPATYLSSPSGDQTFWSESRDGKNTLFIGDADGNNQKQVGTLSQYEVYGWYTDDYLLVSKNASELYIMPASGIKDDSQAVKITDYHKPSQSFYGYGGGYGGL